MYKRFFKRLIDIVLAFLGIVVLAIPMLLVAVAVKLDSPGPVFFKQKRIGARKSTFMILKYRSMPVSAPHDMPTHEFTGEASLSNFQRALRASSMDELPQLFNILAGQMSMIGPRPALWNQYDLIAERDKYGANDVRPGLTGWAQINGRDTIEIEDKARLDGDYVKSFEKHAFRTDCRCLLRTVLVVFKKDGVVEGGTGKMAGRAEK